MYIYQQTEKPSFASLLPLLALAPLALLALSTLFSTAIPTVTTTGRKKRSVLLRSNGTEDDQDLAEALEGLILGHTDLELEDVRSQAVASMLACSEDAEAVTRPCLQLLACQVEAGKEGGSGLSTIERRMGKM